jgi:O-antigen/teichoic acid export membrane protein
MVIVNIAINLVLIPKFSYVGASAAILITEFIALAILFFLADRELYVLKKAELANIVLKIVGASAIMGLFVAYLQNLNLILVIVSASILYFGTLYIVKGIEKEDIALLKTIIQSNISTRKTE